MEEPAETSLSLDYIIARSCNEMDHVNDREYMEGVFELHFVKYCIIYRITENFCKPVNSIRILQTFRISFCTTVNYNTSSAVVLFTFNLHSMLILAN